MAKVAKLDDKEIELLLVFVRSKPFIYDSTSDSHKDRVMIKNTWNKIASDINKKRKDKKKQVITGKHFFFKFSK